MWKGYNVQRGKLSDAFKQYLRDRGLYFEPSENGTYIHFEVKDADESVDRFLKTIDSIIHDSCPIGDDTPKNKNEIALYIGTFDIEKQDTKWKKIQTFKKLKEGYQLSDIHDLLALKKNYPEFYEYIDKKYQFYLKVLFWFFINLIK